MLNRREYIKNSLSAGLVLGTGSLLNSCTGLKRGGLNGAIGAENRAVQLDFPLLRPWNFHSIRHEQMFA